MSSNRWSSVIVTLCVLAHISFTSVQAHAQDVEGEDCKQAYALSNPCNGVLLPPKEAAAALRCITIELPRSEELRLHIQTVMGLDIKRLDALLMNEQAYSAGLQGQLALAVQELESARNPSWYAHPMFLVGAGFLGGVVTVLVVVLAR